VATNHPHFQQVLEALQRAQTHGAIGVLDDHTSRETDDQDCYPRAIVLAIERSDPRWPSLRFLAKHLDWVSLEPGKRLLIHPPQPISFRVTEANYLRAVAESLRESGIECFSDVFYR
jgi:hypothetical protein